MKPDPSRSGTPFGRYVLDKRIGRGGMAEVFAARYQAAAGVTKRVVVKKILPHRSDDADFVKMFISEAKITASLSHGNLVQVFDFGVVDDSYFLAMEYVEGATLGRVLSRAEDAGLFVMPAPYAVSVIMEACKGLHYAHTKTGEDGRPLGIVHRDVTPENILISYEGQVKVADFGVAKASVPGRSETEPGVVKGKLLYLSPEQARAEKVDARTDVFALGVVLFRMLCGSHPFSGSDLNVMQQIAFGGGTAPSDLNPELDAELEKILLKAMARDVSQRYASAQALLQALSTWLNRHAPAHPPDAIANLMSWLYEADLRAQSRPVQVPQSFLEMVPVWQSVQVKHSAKKSRDETTPLRSPSRGSARAQPSAEPSPGAAPRRVTAPLPTQRMGRWPLIAGGALVAVLAISAGAYFATRPTTMTARIETDPAGATVSIDGFETPGVTPLQAQLSADVAHEIAVTRAGYLPWKGTVKGEAGEVRSVWASLTKVQAPPPPVVAEKTEEQPAPMPVPTTGMDVDGAPAKFTLLRSRHSWDPKSEKAMTYELPPGSWAFHGEGVNVIHYEAPPPKNSDERPLPVRVATRRLLYAWYRPGESDAVQVGYIEGNPPKVKDPKKSLIPGGGRLKVFVLMEYGAKYRRFSYVLTAMESKTRRTVGATIDSMSSPFARSVSAPNRARVRQLVASREYVVTVSAPKGQGAATAVCSFGRPEREEEVPRPEQLQLLTAPATVRISGVVTAWCTMLDLGAGSAEQVTVEIK